VQRCVHDERLYRGAGSPGDRRELGALKRTRYRNDNGEMRRDRQDECEREAGHRARPPFGCSLLVFANVYSIGAIRSTSETAMALTYSSYLKVDELLTLQRPVSEGKEHDEMLFIIIHQSYELWFKQLLHEVDFLIVQLEAMNIHRAQHIMKRVLTILKVMVAKIDILETMTPLEFLSFRNRLESASGFQSAQFRELEFLLGSKRTSSMAQFPEGSPERQRLERRYHRNTLWDTFLHFLCKSGYPIPSDSLERDVTRPIEADEAVQKVLVDVYRTNYMLGEFCERLVDLDEGLQEWRYRHIKMVERTIGTKRGTGGSSGVEYLMSTLLRPLFPDLWAIRTEL
jgi:tryptophan 2,3-dioxygenase